MRIAERRRFFAEEVEAAAGLRSPALVEAFATVERERFVGPGPWILKGADGDLLSSSGRQTPDANPERVYHNVSIALDPARQLYNGQPSTVGAWIERLAIAPGARVLHVGAGTGYFTAVMACLAGAGGRVVACEVDPTLAGRARDNLAAMSRTFPDLPAMDLRNEDSTTVEGPFDAILVNAGITHPLDAWLDALAPGGRMVAPITFGFGPSPITKGVVVLLKRQQAGYAAQNIGFAAIYSAVGIRDESVNATIASALKANPMPRLSALRRDRHEPSPSCWLHAASFCLEQQPSGNPVS
jgi:protein-L-isoaspartate(D-aspartate) O-methyltransferase